MAIKSFLLFLAFALPLFLWQSCQRHNPLNSAVISRQSISEVEYDNPEILRIAREARSGFPQFFRHLTRPNADESNFCIKYPFTEVYDNDIITEQIWLTGIRFRNGRYYGTPVNTPLHISGMRKGRAVNFSTDGITDWMFVRNGKIIGGQSIKYLLEQIPEQRRTDEQKELLLLFDD